MFVVVIVAHLLAVLFSFCGVVMLAGVLSGPTFNSAAAFTLTLAAAAWPLAVAAVIELLVQIACMLEKLLLNKQPGADAPDHAHKSPFKPVIKKQVEPSSASGRFFRSNPVPEPPPVEPLAEPAPVAEPKPAPAPPQATPDPEKKEPEKKEPALSFFRVD